MTTRKLTAVLGWFPTTPTTDSAVIDMATSKQIALWTRLRYHYWLTDCRPLTGQTVALVQKKMSLIDPKDAMDEADTAQVLTSHFGFEAVGDAWTIPELLAHREGALEAFARASARGKKGGTNSGISRAKAAETPAPGSLSETDF